MRKLLNARKNVDVGLYERKLKLTVRIVNFLSLFRFKSLSFGLRPKMLDRSESRLAGHIKTRKRKEIEEFPHDFPGRHLSPSRRSSFRTLLASISRAEQVSANFAFDFDNPRRQSDTATHNPRYHPRLHIMPMLCREERLTKAGMVARRGVVGGPHE